MLVILPPRYSPDRKFPRDPVLIGLPGSPDRFEPVEPDPDPCRIPRMPVAPNPVLCPLGVPGWCTPF